MRFLHTSDWHLGRIFYGTHLTNDQAHVLDQLVALIKDVQAEALIIAGDIYDRSVPPIEAVQLLDEVLSHILMDCRIPVIMIAGNHDSPERLGFGNRLLARQGLHVVGQPGHQLQPIILHDEKGPVYFLPVPYAEPALVQERMELAAAVDHHGAMQTMLEYLRAGIPRGARTVAIAHAFIAGGEASESERPLSVGGSGQIAPVIFKPFHYTALGHLHNSQTAGGPHTRYAGSLLKYSFDEANHRKGINIIDLDGAGNVALEQVSLSPCRDVRRIEGFLQDILEAPQGNREDYLMVTLRDTEPILDVMGKLRQVYPQVLHVERPALTINGDLRKPFGDHRRQGEEQLFGSFFTQVTGQGLSDEQGKEMAVVLDELFRKRREAMG
jgi:DNA repair protein SbcD/Mre11